MSESKFTPGPWRNLGGARKDSNFGGYAAMVHGPEVARVAKVYGGNKDDRDVTLANAALIAAAPDLYEALQDLLHDDGPSHNSWDRARAALAKAEGRS